MYARPDREEVLLMKLRDLSDGRVAKVEDFIDLLRARDEHRDLVQAAAILTEPSLLAVWDNPDDDIYNDL